MDIDEAIRTMNEAAERTQSFDTIFSDFHSVIEVAREMAEAWRTINEWMSRGGFPPQAWTA